MFEGDLGELDTRTLLSVGAEVRALEDRAAARQLEVALAFADRNPDPRAEADAAGYGAGYDEPLPGGERGRVYGGVGCPAVAEFAPAELGAVFGWSSGAAQSFIGEALALRHRLPRCWPGTRCRGGPGRSPGRVWRCRRARPRSWTRRWSG